MHLCRSKWWMYWCVHMVPISGFVWFCTLNVTNKPFGRKHFLSLNIWGILPSTEIMKSLTWDLGRNFRRMYWMKQRLKSTFWLRCAISSFCILEVRTQKIKFAFSSWHKPSRVLSKRILKNFSGLEDCELLVGEYSGFILDHLGLRASLGASARPQEAC